MDKFATEGTCTRQYEIQVYYSSKVEENAVADDDHQVASHRMEISEQQRVIAEVQTELKHEMKKLRGNQESSSHVRPPSFTCRDVLALSTRTCTLTVVCRTSDRRAVAAIA